MKKCFSAAAEGAAKKQQRISRIAFIIQKEPVAAVMAVINRVGVENLPEKFVVADLGGFTSDFVSVERKEGKLVAEIKSFNVAGNSIDEIMRLLIRNQFADL